jgi:hypothetical protein
MAIMLVAHARRCDGCFGGSRRQLTALGFDEPPLDGFCANPTVLPLPERERVFVKYVLRIATDPTQVQPKDFREMEAHGLSRTAPPAVASGTGTAGVRVGRLRHGDGDPKGGNRCRRGQVLI